MFWRNLIWSTTATTIVSVQQTYATTNGRLSERGMHSYAAAITDHGNYVCGGTILTTYFILTAAHCFKRGTDHNHIQVIAGTRDLNVSNINNYKKNVQKIIIHPRYSSITKDFDVALVRLATYMILQTENVQAINMANGQYDEYYNDDAVALGWGHGKESLPKPGRLNYVHMTIWDRKKCTSKRIWGDKVHYLFGALVSERMLCVSLRDGGPGTCDDDDGSGLIADGQVVGVLSWHYDCHSIGKPSVYTSVALLRVWLERVIANFENLNK